MNAFFGTLKWIAPLALVGVSFAPAEAAWPRYRVSAAYSLPSAPAQYRPTIAPVPLTPVYPVAPSVYTPAPSYPTFSQPTFQQPLNPPDIQIPHQSFYAPAFQPAAAHPIYNPASHASYYRQPMPMAIHPAQPPVQPAGAYYQPTRPSSFYSPVPSYHYAQPIYGQY